MAKIFEEYKEKRSTKGGREEKVLETEIDDDLLILSEKGKGKLKNLFNFTNIVVV